MRPEREPSSAACVLITAVGWLGVQRVVVLLTARGYAVDSFATVTAPSAPSWDIRITLRCRPAELLLLQARLERLPCVTSVRTQAATAGDLPGAHRLAAPDHGPGEASP